MPQERAEEQHLTCLHLDAHFFCWIDFSVNTAAAGSFEFDDGLEAFLVAVRDDAQTALLDRGVLERDPDGHARFALGDLGVVGVVLVPVTDFVRVRLFADELGRINGDAGLHDILDEVEDALVFAETLGQI